MKSTKKKRNDLLVYEDNIHNTSIRIWQIIADINNSTTNNNKTSRNSQFNRYPDKSLVFLGMDYLLRENIRKA